MNAIFKIEDDKVWHELLYYLRSGGMKYNAALPPIDHSFNMPPIYENIYSKIRDNNFFHNTWSNFVVDVKEIIGYDRALSLTALLLLKKIKNEKPMPELILAMETTGFTLVGAILALHDLFFPEEKLEACYIRKNRKSRDLGRLMEGTRLISGKNAVFVDDFLNRGGTFNTIANTAKEYKINLQKGLFIVQNDEIKTRQWPNIPCDSLFRLSQIRDPKIEINKNNQKYDFEHNEDRIKPRIEKETKDPLWQLDILHDKGSDILLRSDIELVRLAKDSALVSTMTNHFNSPYLKYDGRGSFGYLPFLDKYLTDKGAVIIKINKREFKNGRWINRQRGYAFSGFNDNDIAHNVVRATVKACKKSPRLHLPHDRGPFHKSIWMGELGSLSFFVFIVEKKEKIDRNDLKSIKFHSNNETGLIIKKDDYYKVILEDFEKPKRLNSITDSICSNLFNDNELRNFRLEDDPEIYKISGKWLWLPERPKKYFFNHIN
jgi:orotate phosphoribosyltransferase